MNEHPLSFFYQNLNFEGSKIKNLRIILQISGAKFLGARCMKQGYIYI